MPPPQVQPITLAHDRDLPGLGNLEGLVPRDAAEKGRPQRLIDSTDRKIDALVYELYELTPEEIAVMEGQGAEQRTVNE